MFSPHFIMWIYAIIRFGRSDFSKVLSLRRAGTREVEKKNGCMVVVRSSDKASYELRMAIYTYIKATS